MRYLKTKLLSVAALTTFTSAAFAQDIAAAVTDLEGVEADIQLVGGALIGLAVVAIGIKWVKASIFG